MWRFTDALDVVDKRGTLAALDAVGEPGQVLGTCFAPGRIVAPCCSSGPGGVAGGLSGLGAYALLARWHDATARAYSGCFLRHVAFLKWKRPATKGEPRAYFDRRCFGLG